MSLYILLKFSWMICGLISYVSLKLFGNPILFNEHRVISAIKILLIFHD
jgi:hypothetical protein